MLAKSVLMVPRDRILTSVERLSALRRNHEHACDPNACRQASMGTLSG